MNVICDLDGTIADLSHRLHWIKTKPKNYKAFFAAVSGDAPIIPVIAIVQAPLYMRKTGDYRPDDVIKLELLVQMRADGF